MFVDTERVTYLKDTCLDLTLVKAKIKVGSRHNFGLYDAHIENAVESLKSGAAGLSCIQGNYFPNLVVWLCENYDDNEQSIAVEKVMNFFKKTTDLMHDVYPASAKYCLQKQGLSISTTVRGNPKVFPADVEKKIDNLIDSYLVLQKELQLKPGA